jgi:PD-(D/E)XK nuclease superfamily
MGDVNMERIENMITRDEAAPDREKLVALVIDNPELEALEAQLEQFNIFDALDAVRQEARHSAFLAFLLNPQQNHGLDDILIKRLLQKALLSNRELSAPITPIDLDVWSMSQIEVRREWQNIDILVLDETHELAVIIENKIDSTEHSDQLARYRQVVSQHYPSWRLVGLYLTREGEEATDTSYLPLAYDTLAGLLESIVANRSSVMGVDVRTLIVHYTQMLRRYIVSESDIAKLCRRIYRKHQRALDLIYEYRPDQQAELREILEALVRETPGLGLDHCTKRSIRFFPIAWDVPSLQVDNGWQGGRWTASGRILLFEFTNSPESLKLSLIIGPGPAPVRQKLFEVAQSHQPPFRLSFRTMNRMWNTIFSRSFLMPKAYEGDMEEITGEIRKNWDKFLENDLPALKAVLDTEVLDQLLTQ